MDFLADIFLYNEAATIWFRAQSKDQLYFQGMHCVSNLKSGFDFTAIFQIIMTKYSKNMAEQIQNKTLTPELRA